MDIRAATFGSYPNDEGGGMMVYPNGHKVEIEHQSLNLVKITLDGFELKGVSSFQVQDKAPGVLSEMTITLNPRKVIIKRKGDDD